MCVNTLTERLESAHKIQKIEGKLKKIPFNKWRTD